MKNIRMGWEALGATQTDMVTSPAYQLAENETTLVTPTSLGTDTLTGVGVKYPSGMTDASATTQAHQLFRAGMYVKNASGSNPNFVHVRAWLEWED